MAPVTTAAPPSVRRAFAFDLDGTITTDELLPLIAEHAGVASEMRELTEMTMAGLVPFEQSFRLRFELLRDVPLSVVHEVVDGVSLDEEVVGFIREHREDSFVVTGNLDVWVRPLLDRLGCRYFSSRATWRGDSLLELEEVLSKDTAVAALRERYDRVVAVGDGANDIPLFRASDVSVAFGQVHEPPHDLCAEAEYVVFTGGSLCRLLSTL